MLTRYQTGPLATAILFFAVAFWIVWGLYRALRQHETEGWLQAGFALFVLYNFHRRFSMTPQDSRDTE